MKYLVMLGFEEMNQPIKVYDDRAGAERDIEAVKEIMVRLWAAWPVSARFGEWPEEVAAEKAELIALFPVFGRERIINATMHPRVTFGDDWCNWQIVEVDAG